MNNTVVLQKQNFSSRNIKYFKTELSFVNWEFLNDIKDPNSAYEEFLLVFSDVTFSSPKSGGKTEKC